MALDYNRLTSITREKVLPSIVDQISEESPTLGRFLKKAELISGGTVIQQPVKYRQNSQGGYYSGLELLDTAQETTRTRAQWDWKQFHKPIVINNIERAENQGDAGIVNIMTAEMEDAKEGMRDQMSQALFGDGTGNDGKAMDGLLAAVDDGTNVATYGNIDRSVYTWWQANYTGSIGILVLGDMATMYDSCEHGGKRPDVIITTRDIWSDYEALLVDQIRYTAGENGAVLNGGASKLVFRTTPIEKDDYCPTGKMFFLNMGTFKYVYLKHPDYPTDKNGFAMRDLREPDNQDGNIGFIFSYHNVVCIEPRANGQLNGIS